MRSKIGCLLAGVSVLSLAHPALAAQDPVTIGASPNNGQGDPFRVAAIKLNKNDAELYAAIASIQSVLASLVAANPVTSVAGRRGAVVLSSTDLSDATSLGRSILNSATAGTVLNTLGAAPIANPTFTGTVNIPALNVTGSATVSSLAVTGLGSTGDVSGMSVKPTGSLTTNTIAALLGRTVYITDFMPLGSSDVTTALGLAEARLGASGGAILFPSRSACYTQTAPHALVSNIVYQGEGRGPSCVSSNFQGDVWTIDGGSASTLVQNASVKRINFQSSITRTSGAAIRVSSAYNTLIEDVSCDLNDYICIDVQAGAGQFKTHIVRPFAPFPGYVGFRIGFGSTGTSLTATEVWLDTPMAATHTRAGLEIVAVSGLKLQNPDFFLNGINVLIDPGNGQLATAIQSTDGFIDTATNEGVKIAPTGTGRVTDSQFTSLWSASNGQSTGAAGVLLQGTTASIRSVTFTSPRLLNNGGPGFSNQGSFGTDLIGPEIGFNSQTSSGAYSGISVGAGVSNWTVMGGRSGPGTQFTTSTQKYGLEIAAGSGNNFAVQGTDFTGNLTGAISNGATGANQSIVTLGAPYSFMGANVGVGTAKPYNALTVVDASRDYTQPISGFAGFQVGTGTGANLDTAVRFGAAAASYGWMQCGQPGSQSLPCLVNPNGGGVSLGQSAPAVSATSGFAYIGATSGTPTGTPASIGGLPLSGMAPITVDTTNGKLCAYVGTAWKCATLQ